MSTSELLAACWDQWAQDLSGLLDAHWRLPTGGHGRDVTDLAAHLAPDVDALRSLQPLDGPAAVDDTAVLLRRADDHGERDHAVSTVTRVELAARFRAAAAWLREWELAPDDVVQHPVVGSVTTRVLVEWLLVEAVRHHQDLRAAVTRPPLPETAMRVAADVLTRMVEPEVLVEAATGRTPPHRALPVTD